MLGYMSYLVPSSSSVLDLHPCSIFFIIRHIVPSDSQHSLRSTIPVSTPSSRSELSLVQGETDSTGLNLWFTNDTNES